MANDLDILIKLLLDNSTYDQTRKGIIDIAQQMEKFDEKIKETERSARELKSFGRDLGQVSREIAAAGLILAGGIFAAANKYVKDAKEATEVTTRWKAAQESLAKSGEKTGAVFAQEALPLLEKAAQVAERAASFIEKNPAVVRAALNTGLILAGLGAAGSLLSKGITLVADARLIAATIQQQIGHQIFANAVKEFLVGVNEFAGAKGLPGVGGGLGGAINSPLGIGALGVGLIAANVAIAKELDTLEKILNEKSQGIGTLISNIANTVTTALPGLPLVGPLREIGQAAQRDIPLLKGFVDKLLGIKPAAESATQASSFLGGSKETQDKLLASYEAYRNDDLALVQKHYADRQKIIDDSLKAEQASNANFERAIAQISAQESSALASAAANFAQANAKAEQDYNNQREEIIKSGNDDIVKIEEDSKERLRKLAQDHADRLEDLTRSRDALGIARENRDFARQKNEEQRQTGLEIRQRRAEIAQRLEDLARSFEQERAQRLADYQAQVEEIKTNAAAQAAELAAQHEAELKQIREQKAARIKELDSQFIEERKRRYDQFIQNIRDLDASLLGEKNLRDSYNQKMLADLDAFLASYQQKLGTLATSTPAKAGGGYAAYGTYLLGDQAGGGRGKVEYILSGRTTEMAERLIGGSLTQERLLSALAMAGGGGGRTVNYTDQRRLGERWSLADRNRMQKLALDVMKEALQ